MAAKKKLEPKQNKKTALLALKVNRPTKRQRAHVVEPKVIDGELIGNPLDWRVDALRELLETTKLGRAFAAASDVLTPILMMLGAFTLGVGRKASGVAPFLETFQTRLAAQLESVDPTKLVPPPPRIAGPLLAQYVFVEDDEDLRVLFEKLLATAVNSETRDTAHPAFVEVLKQLSPTEAKLLKGLAKEIADRQSALLPYLEARGHLAMPQPTYMIIGSISPLDDVAGVTLLATATSNLERLGILKIRMDTTLNPGDGPDPYEVLRRSALIPAFADAAKGLGRALQLQPGFIEVTQFGLAFIIACVHKLDGRFIRRPAPPPPPT